MIWFVSDYHFFHQNIFEYEPVRKQFQEKYIEEMIKRYNSVVKPKDTVFFVGDIFVGFNQYKRKCESMLSEKFLAKRILDNMNGNKILIYGNHDHKTDKWYKDIGFQSTNAYFILNVNRKKIGICHYPLCEVYLDTNTSLREFKKKLGNIDLLIHGHTHSANPCQECEIPHFNVSVENINFTPISLEEIYKNFLK